MRLEACRPYCPPRNDVLHAPPSFLALPTLQGNIRRQVSQRDPADRFALVRRPELRPELPRLLRHDAEEAGPNPFVDRSQMHQLGGHSRACEQPADSARNADVRRGLGHLLGQRLVGAVDHPPVTNPTPENSISAVLATNWLISGRCWASSQTQTVHTSRPVAPRHPALRRTIQTTRRRWATT